MKGSQEAVQEAQEIVSNIFPDSSSVEDRERTLQDLRNSIAVRLTAAHQRGRTEGLEEAKELADLRERRSLSSPEYETPYMAGERKASHEISLAIGRSLQAERGCDCLDGVRGKKCCDYHPTQDEKGVGK